MTAGEDPVRLLLDGLGVQDIGELRRLVDAGRQDAWLKFNEAHIRAHMRYLDEQRQRQTAGYMPAQRMVMRIVVDGLPWCAQCRRAVDRGWSHAEGCALKGVPMPEPSYFGPELRSDR